MPFWSLVVNHRPKLDCFVVSQQVDVKGHANSRAIQVVPEVQAEGATIETQRAQQTCRGPLRDATSLKVQVETTCRKS